MEAMVAYSIGMLDAAAAFLSSEPIIYLFGLVCLVLLVKAVKDIINGEAKQTATSALDHGWSEASRTEADCITPGLIRYSCSRCGFSAAEEVPALGSDHIWEETSRADASETAAGSVTYACSACGASRLERLPPSGLDLSMSGLLDKISEVLTVCLGWLGMVADAVVRNPILLFVAVIGFIGMAVVLFRRLLRL